MLKSVKRYWKLAKEHPILFCIAIIIGGGLGYLIAISTTRIIDDISKGISNGSITSLNVLTLVGSIAGLVSLVWQILSRYKTQPDISGTVEIIENEGFPDKLVVNAKNYGRTVDINRIGFSFLGGEYEYYHYYTGTVRKRLMASGIPYKEEFDIQKIASELKSHNTSLKYAFIEDDNTNKYKIKISKEIIRKVDTLKAFIKTT